MENQQKAEHNHTKLTQIQELSQQNQTRNLSKKIEVVVTTTSKTSQQKLLALKKSLQCFKNMLSFCVKKSKKTEFKINEEDMTKQVEKIKKRKTHVQSLLPPICNIKLKTLVLDMDQTLVSSSFKKTKSYDFSTQVQINGQNEKVYVTKRFGLDIFLFQMSQLYQLVVFTAGLKDYTNRVLQIIDPQKRISYVLTRQQCTILNKSYFLKNLSLLGRPLKRTMLIDDNSMAGMLQPQNFYKIQPFYGDSHDRKLLRLIEFLKLMAQQQDFSRLLQKRKTFESKQKRPSSLLNKNIKSSIQWQIKPQQIQASSHSLAKESKSEVILE